MNNTKRDVAYNTCMPKLKSAGWEEANTYNILDDKGIKTDLQTIFINKKKPGKVFINKLSKTIETTNPIRYEELYWFSEIGINGGFDEDDWTW